MQVTVSRTRKRSRTAIASTSGAMALSPDWSPWRGAVDRPGACVGPRRPLVVPRGLRRGRPGPQPSAPQATETAPQRPARERRPVAAPTLRRKAASSGASSATVSSSRACCRCSCDARPAARRTEVGRTGAFARRRGCRRPGTAAPVGGRAGTGALAPQSLTHRLVDEAAQVGPLARVESVHGLPSLPGAAAASLHPASTVLHSSPRSAGLHRMVERLPLGCWPGNGPGRSRTSARRFEVCRSIH
jgi:hypothetical protein